MPGIWVRCCAIGIDVPFNCECYLSHLLSEAFTTDMIFLFANGDVSENLKNEPWSMAGEEQPRRAVAVKHVGE